MFQRNAYHLIAGSSGLATTIQPIIVPGDVSSEHSTIVSSGVAASSSSMSVDLVCKERPYVLRAVSVLDYRICETVARRSFKRKLAKKAIVQSLILYVLDRI